MFKEIIISLIIIISIVSLDLVTQKYTKESVQETSIKLSSLKEKIKTQNSDLNQNLDDILTNWEKRRKRLSYYIEHDELEKVEVNLTNLRSYIEELNFNMAINSIDEAKYLLEHFKDKNAFNLENIF